MTTNSFGMYILILFKLLSYQSDIKEIIWFINPTGMQYLVQTPEIYDKMMFVHQWACSLENWVYLRHKSFYVWMMYGWRQLSKEYPSYDSAGPLKPIELS